MAFEDDIKQAQKKLENLNKKAVPKATARAINKVGSKVMVRSIATAAKEADVPKKLIKGRAKLEKAKPSHLSAYIKVNRGNLPAIRIVAGKVSPFLTRGKRRGQLKVGKRFYERAFIQKLANGRVHVLQRQGKARYPIDVVKIPLVKPLTEAFESEVKKALESEMPKEMKAALEHQITLVVKNK
ncbi:TPA: phage tail protein [Pasteurella multocida]|nr:phage tail protein [Pasteurella multocida]